MLFLMRKACVELTLLKFVLTCLLLQNVSKGSHLSPSYRCLLAHGIKASCLNVYFKKVDINFMKTNVLTEIAY